jgi:hypothetical protein
MTHDEYLSYASEVNELEAILAGIPAENVIDRMGLEARLQAAKAALQQAESDKPPLVARLTFRGTPVLGSHGISADFAVKAAGFFTDAFSATVAGLAENLRYMGPIPDKQKNQLMITATAVGSFGFEFELPRNDAAEDPEQLKLFPPDNAPDKAENAMAKLEKLFQLAANGNDDEVAELVEEIHPRAVKKVADFLNYLSEQNAWCGLEFKDEIFRFSGRDQVCSSAARLASNNLKETNETFSGSFQGILPLKRTFEFKLSDQDGILSGKVGADIEDMGKFIRDYLFKPVSVMFNTIQVGQGRPRHTLNSLNDITMLKTSDASPDLDLFDSASKK